MKLKGKVEELLPKASVYLLNLDKSKDYVVEIKQYKEQRSKDANAYFHVLVNKLARYQGIADDVMKIEMNLQYGTVYINEVTGKVAGAKLPKGTNPFDFYEYSKWYGEEDNCDLYIYYKRTHTLDKAEMAKLIDGVVQECKDVGIETLTPRELEELKRNWGES
jgi:hypothetical protein